MYVIPASSPLGPQIQWFLYGSQFIPDDVIKLPVLCQMLDVFQHKKKEKHPTGLSMFGQGK